MTRKLIPLEQAATRREIPRFNQPTAENVRIAPAADVKEFPIADMRWTIPGTPSPGQEGYALRKVTLTLNRQNEAILVYQPESLGYACGFGDDPKINIVLRFVHIELQNGDPAHPVFGYIFDWTIGPLTLPCKPDGTQTKKTQVPEHVFDQFTYAFWGDGPAQSFYKC